MQADEAVSQVLTALSSTTLSGFVGPSAIWKFGTGNRLTGRSFDGKARAEGLIFIAMVYLNPVSAAITEEVFETLVVGGSRQNDVSDAVASEVIDEVEDQRAVEDGEEGLWQGVAEGPEPGAAAPDQHYRVQSYLVPGPVAKRR